MTHRMPPQSENFTKSDFYPYLSFKKDLKNHLKIIYVYVLTEPLEQVFVSHPAWVLGFELKSS